MPIQTLADSYTAGDYNISGTDAAKMLADKIEIGLTKTNKMAVLDRRHVAEVLANQNFNYYLGSLEERARIGNALGSDYMFIGMIADMRITVETKNIEAVGVVSSEYEAAFGFDYRVVNAQTLQIKMADAIKIRLGNDQVKMLIDQRTKEVDYKDMLDNLMSMAAEGVVANIMEQLYPVKIAAISDSEQIVINQGQGRIFEGMVLNVVAEGEEIFDSETNESLGKTENTVAKIQVYKTMANISYAKLIEGKIADIAVDMICRPVMDEFGGYQETDNGAKSKIEITPQGGVKLPSD
jgi:hypothetical protein